MCLKISQLGGDSADGNGGNERKRKERKDPIENRINSERRRVKKPSKFWDQSINCWALSEKGKEKGNYQLTSLSHRSVH